MGKGKKKETMMGGRGGSKNDSFTKKSKKVESLLYSKSHGNRATMYGIEKETEARNDYVKYQQNNDHPCLKTERVGLVYRQKTHGWQQTRMMRYITPVLNHHWGWLSIKTLIPSGTTSLQLFKDALFAETRKRW